MLDDPSAESNAESVVSAADVFYGDSEPSVAPTEEPEEVEITESQDEPEEAADEGRADEGDDGEEEIEVYDEKKEFVKYSQTEEGLYEFKSNGKTVQVDIDNLIDNFTGAQKQAAEIQKLAEAKKGVFEKAQQDQIELYKSEVAKVQEKALQLDALLKDEIDPNLKLDDPDEYIRQTELREKRQEALGGIIEEAQKKQQEQLVEARKAENEKLLTAMGWETDEALKEDFSRWQSYLKNVRGFTDEKIQAIGESDAWLIINDAAKYHESLNAEVKEVKNKPRVVKVKRKSEPKKQEKPKTTAEVFYGSK